ncbi:aminotransferase class V-fold PLP-dependent enzyme [Chlamydiifrater phoenicopteri]|uniref:aminotransferase class V-fold PLP-dependent enzyme n=1 Tax=Chlamydiifrater phoenicopteri TaxID=2681469 RepID=UPI001BCC496E|nr:aminotransferase class V-fold PLP-dependent enzyme [Chlamydiifrater phoenicopteri]
MFHKNSSSKPVIWLNNEVARPPTEASRLLASSSPDVFSLEEGHSIQDLLEKSEENIRTLVPASKEVFRFSYALPSSQSISSIISSLLLHSQLFQGRSHFLVPSHDQQTLITAICRRHIEGASYDWMIPNKNGIITEESFIDSLSPKTLMVSLSLANGLTGVIQPLEAIKVICKERNILLHVDVSHALGKIPLSEDIFDADIITFSGFPLGCSGAVGGCFFRHHLSKILSPILPDTQSLLQNFSLGTILSFSNACKERTEKLSSFALKTGSLNHQFRLSLSKEIPEVQYLFDDTIDRLPNIILAAFPDVPAEALAFLLQNSRICVAMGYENFQPLSQVLQSCGIPPLLCHSSIGFSLHESLSATDLSTVINEIKKNIAHLTTITKGAL